MQKHGYAYGGGADSRRAARGAVATDTETRRRERVDARECRRIIKLRKMIGGVIRRSAPRASAMNVDWWVNQSRAKTRKTWGLSAFVGAARRGRGRGRGSASWCIVFFVCVVRFSFVVLCYVKVRPCRSVPTHQFVCSVDCSLSSGS